MGDNLIKDVYAINYDVSLLDNSVENKEIKYGYEVFRKTPKYLGPNNGNPDMAYAGNRLSCNNCHLWSGTKPYSAPLIGIIQRFPQYRGRENKMGTIEERINGCMERSMNGRMMPTDSKEMKAMVAYLNWLSRSAPKDGKIKGQGFVKIEIPARAVNLENGKKIFKSNCIVCHGNNGQGVKSTDGFTYQYPPLWGDDSYNNGAGMTRVITAARFIKANMPYGATYETPILTDEEAYDVAGYINQQLRSKKRNSERDFPDLKKKPVSTPYPPYADTFSIQQHQLGPFQPIMEYYKNKFNIVKSK
ncbi:MAG: c-type cytochrome [Saonia sp.]